MEHPRHHQLKFAKTAHYYTLGHLSDQTEYIWLVCHGYGQAAETFIKKFNTLNLATHFIIAPEGLSRFYWEGFSGEVVSSWMTSKDRLCEIEDYVSYLDQVYTQFSDPGLRAKWIMLGFSQGVSTLMRFLGEKQPIAERILLWAGVFPPELNYLSLSSYLNESKVHFFYGNEDEFISEARLEQEMAFAKKAGIQVSLHPFMGKHRIERNVLESFVSDELSRAPSSKLTSSSKNNNQ